MTTALMMGFSLAAATGLRGGLPLLVTVTFARAGQIPWHPHFAFLTTDAAIGILLIATLIEMGGDFIPGLDHALDLLHTLLRPASATLIMAGLLFEINPIVGLLLGLMIGASISGLVHFVKAGGRVIVSMATFGIANAVLSLLENIVAGILTLFALVAPTLVFFMTLVFVILLVFIAQRLWTRMRRGWMSIKQRITGRSYPQSPKPDPIAFEEDFSFSASEPFDTAEQSHGG